MPNKIYRNIFFSDKLITRGKGTVDVYYYGIMNNNVRKLKNFESMYDKDIDLLIVCGTCAAKKYRNFIKISKP